MVFSLAQRMNADRFWSTIEASAQTGVGREGGLSRSALSDADKTMRALFVRWCREAGLVVTVDAAGSIFGRRVGIDSNLAPVLIGSHLTRRPMAAVSTVSPVCLPGSNWSVL